MTQQPLKDYKWLVDSRSKIQRFLLKLLNFTNSRKAPSSNLGKGKLEKELKLKGDILGLLVGTSFSLWRAVFLVDKARNREKVFNDAKIFLEFLVRDNAINYAQDLKTQNWTSGYYLNNGRFRLSKITRKLKKLIGSKKVINRTFSKFTKLDKKGIDFKDSQKVWDIEYEAAQAALELLMKM